MNITDKETLNNTSVRTNIDHPSFIGCLHNNYDNPEINYLSLVSYMKLIGVTITVKCQSPHYSTISSFMKYFDHEYDN